MRGELLVGAVMLAALVGCERTETHTQLVPVPVAVSDTCGASTYQTYVGQPQSALTGVVFTQPTRIIGPNSMVTMDMQPTRLNFAVGRGGRIDRVYCG